MLYVVYTIYIVIYEIKIYDLHLQWSMW